MSSRWRISLAVLAGFWGTLGTLGIATEAEAACTPPAPAVIWSYPADGDTGVPTNAMIWIVTSRGRQPQRVLLDGQLLDASPRDFSFIPDQPLTPNANHVVTINPPVGPLIRIRFTTGPGPTERIAPDKPVVHWVSPRATRALSPKCQAIVDAMGCFDAGEDTHLVFAVEGSPLLWLIERVGLPGVAPELHPWPSECGLPEVFARNLEGHLCGRGVRIHAVDASGMRAMTKPFCLGRYLRSGAALPPGEPPPGPDASVEDAAAADAGASADAGAGEDAEYFPLLRSSPDEVSSLDAGGAAEAEVSRAAASAPGSACNMVQGAAPSRSIGLVLVALLVAILSRSRKRLSEQARAAGGGRLPPPAIPRPGGQQAPVIQPAVAPARRSRG
jgi:hypothetical protein